MIRKHDVNDIDLQIDNIDFWGPHKGNKGGMRVYWSATIGFGTLDIVKVSGNEGEDTEGPREEFILYADTEHMDSQEDKDFSRKLMQCIVDKLIIV